jgi:predicted nucleotidyltransferase
MGTSPDFRDPLRSLSDAGVRYVIVGAYAVICHTEPRYAKDLDIWVSQAKPTQRG